MTHTVLLSSASARERAHRLVNAAPPGSVVEVRQPRRTIAALRDRQTEKAA